MLNEIKKVLLRPYNEQLDEYREYKSDISEVQKENFREKIFSGTITRDDITKKTRRLGDEIAKVYGFRIPKQMPDKER